VPLRSARGRSTASQRWLARQLNDPYVAAAKAQRWRSRAAFKLLELDEKCQLLRAGMRVIDLGAAPGGWTQVAVQRGASVVALDLLAIEPIRGATLLQGDFRDPDTPARLQAMLGGKADLVLSDMAPNTTGHAATTICGSWRWQRPHWSLRWRCWPRAVPSSARCFRAARKPRCWRG